MTDLTPANIEDLWSQGIHVDSKGEEHLLLDMPAKYIQNIITHFSDLGYDTSALEEKLQPQDFLEVAPTKDSGFSPQDVVE